MKKLMLLVWPWLFSFVSYNAKAQDNVDKTNDKKETEEIIIRRKGEKDANVNIQINGDKITVNGKPLADFKNGDITINKRKIIVRDRNNGYSRGDGYSGNYDMTWDDNDESQHGAFLGVTTDKTDEGAKITGEISKETAAGKAGLQKGDIVTKIDDKKIDGPQSLYETINAKKPKDEVKISYKRDGKEKATKAVLQERKDSFMKSFSFSSPDGSYKTFTIPPTPKIQGWDGIDADALANAETDQLRALELDHNFNFSGRKKLGLKIQDTEEGNGVKVIDVDDSSAAATAGLKKDDIITEIGGSKVTNTDEARDQLLENREKSSYQIKARRNGSEMNFNIKIPKKLKTANL